MPRARRSHLPRFLCATPYRPARHLPPPVVAPPSKWPTFPSLIPDRCIPCTVVARPFRGEARVWPSDEFCAPPALRFLCRGICRGIPLPTGQPAIFLRPVVAPPSRWPRCSSTFVQRTGYPTWTLRGAELLTTFMYTLVVLTGAMWVLALNDLVNLLKGRARAQGAVGLKARVCSVTILMESMVLAKKIVTVFGLTPFYVPALMRVSWCVSGPLLVSRWSVTAEGGG